MTTKLPLVATNIAIHKRNKEEEGHMLPLISGLFFTGFSFLYVFQYVPTWSVYSKTFNKFDPKTFNKIKDHRLSRQIQDSKGDLIFLNFIGELEPQN